jgi:very-short-patch-repair endonuclease
MSINKQLDNGVKLFQYLEKLALLNINIRNNIRQLSENEESFNIEDKEFLPILDHIFIKNRDLEADKPDGLFLSIERYSIEKPPKLPKQLERWIDFASVGFTKPEPKEFLAIKEKFEDSSERIAAFHKLKINTEKIDSILKDWVTKSDIGYYERIEEKPKKIYFKNYPELIKLYEDWIELKWEKWKDKNKEYFISNLAFDKLYTLRSFLKTESDSYDLLWGHDILSWKQGGKEISYPTLFTPVTIEFDSDRNIISVNADTNAKSYFDVSFVREALGDENTNLMDIDSLAEKINKKINEGDFDIWNFGLVHKYLQQLVHFISPDGESKYDTRDIDIDHTLYPTAYNIHHLFLFKKSGKGWADYAKKIQEDITNNGTLTPFLEDLISIEEDKNGLTEQNGNGTDIVESDSNNVIDGELYFPLPYNDEQKKIACQIESNYGSVVQGPPGTGKTHTIANLISRFLALGKTVLVTSQTSQALSVLKNKIPEEIRSLAVSQVEASSRNDDLQSSVSDINNMLSDVTKYTDRRKEKVEKEVEYIREEIAKKNNEFEKKALLDSREEIIIGTNKFSPITAAQFVLSFANSEKFKILDDVHYTWESVITQAQINEYVLALRNANTEIWDFVKLDKIPTLDILPSVEILERFFELKKELNKEELQLFKLYVPDNKDLENLENIEEFIKEYNIHQEKALKFKKYLKETDFFSKNNISETEFFDKRMEDVILEMHSSLERVNSDLCSFDKPFEKELFEIIKSESQKRRWEDVLSKIDKMLVSYEKSDSVLLGKKMEVIDGYNIDFVSALEILSAVTEQAKNNNNKVKKGIGLWFNPKIRKLIKNIKINGKEICDNCDIEVLCSYFTKIKVENDLDNIWKQAFQTTNNRLNFPNPFNIVDFERSVERMNRVVFFEKEYFKLKTGIEDLKLFHSVNISDISFAEKALGFIDCFCSVFKAEEYSNFIENIANGLEKETAHEKTLLLVKYIREKNIEKIITLKQYLKNLNERKKLSIEYLKLYDDVYSEEMQKLKSNKNNHKSVITFLQNIESSKINGIKAFYEQIPDLIDEQNRSAEIKLIEDKIRESIPETIGKIKSFIKTYGNVDIDIEENWKWKRLVSWLDDLHSGDSISQINKDLQRLKNQEMDLVRNLVEISSWIHLKNRVTKRQKEALASFALSMKKYGKGMGKYAPKHLKDAKDALETGKNAVPVWIMPINTIHQLFPNPAAGMFDVVIFDEASQVDARGLNIAYIGKKLLVVGDDEQVSPTTFTVQSKVTDLITRYISDVPNSHQFSVTSSLFDIAKVKMTDVITLTEHFRSVEEIIGFSNKLSYNGKLKVLRDQLPKYRLDPVLEPIFVENGFEETNAQINVPEQKAIVEKLKEMLQDEKYRETDEEGSMRPITFGVVSLLGKKQSSDIFKLISENISSKEIEKRNIKCGDPYTFQGDERDIMLISMVKAPDLHSPEKTIAPWTANKKENKQRANVAMSRAKNKMILFHSIPKDKLTNPDDLRKQILDWFYNYKTEERKAGLQRVREEVERGRASEFEYEVAEFIINKGYKVIPQYEVAGYRIDLVVQGEKAKLAVECDGDQYHNRIDKWQEDIERQQILERAGWTFWRVTGSAFYKHKDKALDSLWKKLDELNIFPE